MKIKKQLRLGNTWECCESLGNFNDTKYIPLDWTISEPIALKHKMITCRSSCR